LSVAQKRESADSHVAKLICTAGFEQKKHTMMA
jgi:hypothetical protein